MFIKVSLDNYFAMFYDRGTTEESTRLNGGGLYETTPFLGLGGADLYGAGHDHRYETEIERKHAP